MASFADTSAKRPAPSRLRRLAGREAEIERLFDRLRRLVRDRRKLENGAAASAGLEKHLAAEERLRWQIAAAVKRTASSRG